MTVEARYAALALCVAMVGCGTGNPETRPIGTGASTEQLVGAEGGTIELEGMTLEIPPGALTGNQQIRVTSQTTPPPAEYVNISPVYKFEPAGTKFAKPVRVTIPLEYSGDGSGASYDILYGEVAFFWSKESGPGFDQLTPTRVGDDVSAWVTHFSEGFVGRPDADAGVLPEPDAGVDAGSHDAGTYDGGTYDGGTYDGGTYDGGTYDGGTYDGGTYDGGTYDGGTYDGGSSACGPTNCGGCCDSNGQCISGSTDTQCGGGGNACSTCAGGQSCSYGSCVATSPTAADSVGLECAASVDCQNPNAAGTCFAATNSDGTPSMWTDGYCSGACTTNADCDAPVGTAMCVSFGTTNHCMEGCTTPGAGQGSCRTGYSCWPLSANSSEAEGICYPRCDVPGFAGCGAGNVCSAAGHCEPATTDGGTTDGGTTDGGTSSVDAG